MSGITQNAIVDIIVSKLYDVQAFSKNEEYTKGFVNLLGGIDNCIVIRTTRDKIPVDDMKFDLNLLYAFDEVFITQNIDYELDELLQTIESDVVGYFHTMMALLEFYKFTKDEQRLVDKFVRTYDYNFLRDCHGLTVYDYKEYLNTRLLLRMYFSNNKRTKE